jgi:hypothetical protein
MRFRALTATLSAVVLVLVLLVAFIVFSGYPAEISSRQGEHGAPVPVVDLHEVGQLQAAFNHDVGTPRLLVLFSPT